MKYIVVLGDGMADYPVEQLNYRTPLQYANTPTMNYMAKHGITGMVKTVPEGMTAGSDTANMAVFGYNPFVYYSGRSPFEAAGMGVKMLETDITFRCNLVTLSEDEPYEEKIMLDHSAGEITTEEAGELIKALSEYLSIGTIKFYTGISYRHLIIWPNGPYEWKLTPPHDILGKKVKDYMPQGINSEIIEGMIRKSSEFLSQHDINKKRVARGLNPANSIWIWGEGKKPLLSNFNEKYKLKGSVISAVDLIKGIGICAGLDVIDVEGATGNIHTNFIGKAKAALRELAKGKDFVYIHVEAPDECGHRYEIENKFKTIEFIDNQIVKVIKDEMERIGEDYKIMILPDHPTPLVLRTHTSEPVPFLIYQSNNEKYNTSGNYDEFTAKDTGLYFPEGYKLMDYFIKGYTQIYYKSTRENKKVVKSAEAIVMGLSTDGGLFVPTSIPMLNMSLEKLRHMNYKELALTIMKVFLTDYEESELKESIDMAYDEKFDTPIIAPIVKHGGIYFLELYHGPTLAFKDMALSILPYLLKIAVKKLRIDKEMVILTATFGDTGKAALEGFANVEGTKIIVFFPENGVSEIQKKQMLTQTGANTFVIGIERNFDDAQNGVKQMLTDEDLLKRLEENNSMFSSANSINIGRLIPQIVYYFYAYTQLCNMGDIKIGEEINFSVPTGNFGNILAGYYAKKMGLPIKKLICASNENKILFDFINTGIYDKKRDFVNTMSPSMDILISSNLERLLYSISGEDSLKVRKLMEELSDKGKYEIDNSMKNELKDFIAGYASEEDTAKSIAEVYKTTNYVIDTHTAVS